VSPVHISLDNSMTAAGAAGKEQVVPRNCVTGSKTDASAGHSLVEVTAPAVAECGGRTEKSSTHVHDDSHDGWSEVKSVKSPRRRKTNSADSVENQKVTSGALNRAHKNLDIVVFVDGRKKVKCAIA